MNEYIIDNMIGSYDREGKKLPADIKALYGEYCSLTDEARAIINRWYKCDRDRKPKQRGILGSFELVTKIFLFATLGMHKKPWVL